MSLTAMEVSVAVAEWVGRWVARWVAPWEEEGEAVGVGSHKNSVLTAKRSWSAFRRKPEVDCLRFRKNNPLIRSLRGFRRNCAMSTAWDTLPIAQQPATIEFRLLRNRKT